MPARQRLTFAAIAAAIAVVAVVLLLVTGGSDDSGDSASSGTGSTQAAPDTTPEPSATAPAGDATPAATETATATPEPKPAVPLVVVRDGKPVGGVKKLRFDKGDRIRFRVRSDVADHIHVHGYDLMKDVAAGGTVSFSFPASIEGIFEAELEDRGEQVLSLQVNP